MREPARWLMGALLPALVLARGGALAAPTESLAGKATAGAGSLRVVRLLTRASLRDGISREQEAEVERAIAARGASRGAPASKDGEAVLFPFFPQAGVLGRDLFLNNFTDQDSAPSAVRDWDCSRYTYDGHQGHDSLIRSFREQDIGVPVFAVLPGVVADTHDGEPDHNVAWSPENRANLVVLDHGGGLTTWYLHFKTGSVAVAPGDVVAAGTQLGLTGSSGFSDWPHLHFETRHDNRWVEPSSGPCRGGETMWAEQPPVDRDFHVADLYLSRGAIDIPDYEAFLLDESPRAGSFLKGAQTVGLRADFRNLPGGAVLRVQLIDPKRRVALEQEGTLSRQDQHLALAAIDIDVDLATVGNWHLVADLDGARIIDAPFRVVASGGQLGNRKPNRVTARLAPAKPVAGQVMTCTVETSAVTEDPDFDVVAYRYEWRVGTRLVRLVTSAALSDRLPADAARPGERVTCKVTPGDAKVAGAASEALAVVEP
jgi:murein DD-endopeptidase MepM/ murein hydrolase activator NlpD